MNIDPYVAFFKISLKDFAAYFKDYLLSTVGGLLMFIFMIFIWNVVYLGEHATLIDGYSIIQINAYFVIGGALFLLIDSLNDKTVSEDIQSGTIASALIKPVNYAYMTFIRSFADNVMVLPIVLIAVILAIYYMNIPISILSVLAVVIILIIGYITINILQFMVGLLAVYTTSAFGISMFLMNIINLFGGSVMPLNFLPNYISSIAAVLPFQMMMYVPSAILIGVIPTSMYLHYIIIGGIWLLIIGLLGYFFWNHIKKRISSVGG